MPIDGTAKEFPHEAGVVLSIGPTLTGVLVPGDSGFALRFLNVLLDRVCPFTPTEKAQESFRPEKEQK